MSIFAITAPASNAVVEPAIQTHFKDQYIKAWQGYWFVSTSGTAMEVANKLNVADGTVGTVIVTTVANYWGRANPEVWEWLKSRLESK
jgi:hypothetical protein